MKTAIEKTLFRSRATVISIRADGTILADGFNPAVKDLQFSDIRKACAEIAGKTGRPFVPVDAAAGTETFFVLSENGDVMQIGQNSNTSENGTIRVQDWTEITQLAAVSHAVGLRKDGTVVASGNNEYGQCGVSGWAGIRKIACSLFATAGIREDGSVVVCGETSRWKGDVGTWKDIREIFCSENYLLGLDGSGNVFYFGKESEASAIVSGWKNVKKIIGSDDYFAALTRDGTVLTAGYPELDHDAQGWQDIADIEFATYLLVALDKNGKVFVAGDKTESGYSAFEQQVWKTWENVVKVVTFNSGILGLKKDGSIVSCLPEEMKYRPEWLPKAKKWKCFNDVETIDRDYEEGFARFREQMTELSEEGIKKAQAAEAEELANCSWLERTVRSAKTDAERLSAMEAICGKIKRERSIITIPSFIFKLLFLVNTVISICGFFTQVEDRKIMNVVASLPGKVQWLLSFITSCFNKLRDAVIGLLRLFKLELSAEMEILVACAVVMFFLIFVIPPVITLIVRLILGKRKERTAETPRWNDSKKAAGVTYKRLKKQLGKSRKPCATWLPSLLMAAASTLFLVLMMAYPAKFRERSIWEILTILPATFLSYQLIGLIPKLIARAGMNKKRTLCSGDDETFEEFWCTFDEKKRAEVEERRARERAEQERREREKAERSNHPTSNSSYSGGSSYSSGSGSRAVVTIDATAAHYANTFTVYVDGVKECTVEGGRSKDISFSAGRHKIRVQVYNDAAERAYFLDPVEAYFEAGEEYTLQYS